MRTYICVYLGSAVLALLATPVVIRLARLLRGIDEPGVRKVHQSPVPRLGGLAVAVATLVATIAVLQLDNIIGEAFRAIRNQVIGLIAGAAFLLAVGMVDDIRGLKARIKLLAQVAAAAMVCAVGVRINAFVVPGLFAINFGWLSWPITLFWIVGITNAVNLIDGLDGLAAGIAAITCGVIAVFAGCSGQPVMVVLMLALLGSLSGFLFFNFNPARIFLGDGGTYFIGFLLAGASAMSAIKAATIVGLALPLLALGVPIFDTLFSMLRRFLERRSLFSPDRGHIHHRLLSAGLHQRHVVILMYAVTAVAAGLGMFMMATRNADTIIVFACVAFLLLLVFRLAGSVRLREALAALGHKRSVSHAARDDREAFEHAQLLLREATTFDAWWTAACAAAEALGFAVLAMPLTNRDGTQRLLQWHRIGQAQTDAQTGSNGHQARANARTGTGDKGHQAGADTQTGDSGHQTGADAQTGSGGNGAGDEFTLTMTVPIRDRRAGTAIQARIDVLAANSLEAAGRRAALFARLLDEHGLTALPPTTSAAQPANPGGLS